MALTRISYFFGGMNIIRQFSFTTLLLVGMLFGGDCHCLLFPDDLDGWP
jgi:hypothetical protein